MNANTIKSLHSQIEAARAAYESAAIKAAAVQGVKWHSWAKPTPLMARMHARIVRMHSRLPDPAGFIAH